MNRYPMTPLDQNGLRRSPRRGASGKSAVTDSIASERVPHAPHAPDVTTRESSIGRLALTVALAASIAGTLAVSIAIG